MSLSVHAFDQLQMRAHLSSQLGCPRSLPALRTALIADHIRTLVWAPYLRVRDEIVAQPVHTSRIFAALDRNLRFVFSGEAGSPNLAITQHAEFEFVRDQLERCGDICHIGNGYWIPGPMRIVRTPGSQTTVVVGGVPTNILQRTLKTTFNSIGPARYATGLSSAEPVYPEESVEDWLGTTEPLAVWTERTLSWAATQLQPEAGIEDDSIEIYAPDVHRARQRLGFWIDAKMFHEPAPTLRLFRPKTTAGWSFDRPDYIGAFRSQSGGAQLTRSVRLAKDTAYRLRFGLDQKFAIPRTMNLRRSEDAYSLDLKFDLPKPEARVLGFAWRDAAQGAELFFDDFALPALNAAAGMLGVRVQL